ncbi:MAG: ABC transporter ATP-binding protein [Lachnospiraceae bacterium]|nr:ABC transporter ATP-binding protein [Lachnospiraceae bacterium]
MEDKGFSWSIGGDKDIDRIIFYLKKNKKLIIWAFIINIVSALLVVIIPLITGRLFDKLIDDPDMQIIFQFCKYLLGATVLSLIVGYFGAIISTKLKTKMSFELNYEMLNHIQNISLKKTSEINPAYVNNRINSDINSVMAFILEIITNSTITVIKLIVLMAYFITVNIKLAAVILILDLFYVFVFLGLKGKMEKLKNRLKESGNRYYLYLQEQITNIKFIKIFSLQNYFFKRLSNGYKTLYVNLRSDVNLNYGLKSSEALVQMLSQMAIFIIGGIGLIKGNMTVGVFTILISYLQMIIGCTNYCISIGNVYVDTKIAYLRLKEFKDMPEAKDGTKVLDHIDNIEFDDVSFGYNMELISNFHYSFSKGMVYAICGDNGKGKTTLLDLLAGLYPGQYERCIYVNECDMDNLDMGKLRNNLITYSLQKSEILEGDLIHNVIIDRETYDKEYLDYLLKGFQLEYLVDENNSKKISVENISGGEAQKISLVRSLINTTSEMYIFDEPTNNLDRNSQAFFSEIVESLKQKAIVIIATHDKSLLQLCDEIIDL